MYEIDGMSIPLPPAFRAEFNFHVHRIIVSLLYYLLNSFGRLCLLKSM